MTESSKLFSETFGTGAAVARENLALMFGDKADDIIHNQPEVWIAALSRPNYQHIIDAMHNMKLPAKNKKILLDIGYPKVDDMVRLFFPWKNPGGERMEDVIRDYLRPFVSEHMAAKKARQDARTEAWRQSKAGKAALADGKLI